MSSDSSDALLLIVSGPAGSGKTTLCDRMLAERTEVQRVITSTTRAMRPGESDTVDYYFFDVSEFERKIAAGDFYEYAQVHAQGRYYGTLKSEIDGKLAQNIDLLLNIDVQGAAAFRQAAEENTALARRMVSIFIRPQNLDELRQRLATRGETDQEEVERRLETARKELTVAEDYDHVIESGSKEEDYARLQAIYTSEKAKRA